MKTFITLFLCAVFSVFTFCSCNNNERATVDKKDFFSEDSTPILEWDIEVKPFQAKGNSKEAVLNTADGNSQGYYSIFYYGDGTAVLLYTEYSTATTIVLCSQPNCTHHTESCPAWFSCPANIPSILCTDERLVYVYRGNPQAIEMYGNAAKPKIEVANSDGSDRHLVTTLNSDFHLIYGENVIDNENFYALTEVYDLKNGLLLQENQLIQVNLLSGKTHRIANIPWDDGDHTGLLCVYNEAIYLTRNCIGNEARTLLERKLKGELVDSSALNEIYASQTSYVYQLKENGTYRKLNVEWPSQQTVRLFQNGAIYLVGTQKEEIEMSIFNLSEEELSKFKISQEKLEVPFESWKESNNIYGADEDHIIFDQIFYDSQTPSNYQIRYIIDAENKSATMSLLMGEYSSNISPLKLISFNDTEYLVSLKETADSTTELDYSIQFGIKSEYALIKFEDFFTSNPIYRKIK